MNGISSSVSKPFGDVLTSYKQSAMSIVLKLRDLRHDPDFFQKVGQVAAAALEYAIITVPSLAHMSRLVIVLKTVNMHDFYANFTLLRFFFFPISPRAIDELAVLKNLKEIIRNQFNSDVLSDAAIDKLARGALKDELASMSKLMCDSYENADQFRNSLRTFVIDKAPKEEGVSVLAGVDLSQLEVTLRPVSIIERINRIAWVFVDLGCAAAYFKEWDFIDFAKLAQSVGNWVTHVDAGLYGVLTSAFALRFLEAARKLKDDDLTVQERRQAKWDLITSTFETTLYGLSFLKSLELIPVNAASLCLLTIWTKGVGLISIATRPEHEYFLPKIPAAAA